MGVVVCCLDGSAKPALIPAVVGVAVATRLAENNSPGGLCALFFQLCEL